MLLPIYNIQLFNTYEMATLILQRANPFPYFFACLEKKKKLLNSCGTKSVQNHKTFHLISTTIG